jgi:excisionase family DNA binding protein
LHPISDDAAWCRREPNDPVEPHTLSVRDATAFTGLSKSTLNRLVAANELEKLHIGRKALFRVADLKKLTEKK